MDLPKWIEQVEEHALALQDIALQCPTCHGSTQHDHGCTNCVLVLSLGETTEKHVLEIKERLRATIVEEQEQAVS